MGKRCSGIPGRARERAMVFHFVFPPFCFVS
jgi:hypothetical protein